MENELVLKMIEMNMFQGRRPLQRLSYAADGRLAHRFGPRADALHDPGRALPRRRREHGDGSVFFPILFFIFYPGVSSHPVSLGAVPGCLCHAARCSTLIATIWCVAPR